MQQGIKKLQWFEYLKVVFLEILNTLGTIMLGFCKSGHIWGINVLNFVWVTQICILIYESEIIRSQVSII